VPSHDSTCIPGPVCPPAAKPKAAVPPPPKASLAVFKSLTSVQDVPFQDSVLPVLGGIFPAKYNPAAVVPIACPLLLI